MKKFFYSFYGKLSVVFLFLILVMGSIQYLVVYNANQSIQMEAEQKLNRDLAKNMAFELKPFLKDSLDMQNIEHSLHYMMVMNPKVEIYLLDNVGKVLAFFAEPGKEMRNDFVDLKPVNEFLNSENHLLVLGDDPRYSGVKKPFSVAKIKIGKEIDGYVYIVLGSEKYDLTTYVIQGDYVFKTILKWLVLTLLFTGIIGLIVFALLTQRLRKITESVKEFESENYKIRIPFESNDEIGQLARSFNKMAEKIEANIEELKSTDNLRKELVANISHDLRTPLTSAQGYLETILIKQDTLSEEKKKKFMQIILDNISLLNRLVSELFELSLLDANQTKAKPEKFSITELAQDVILKFQPQAEEKNIVLKADYKKNLPLVFADIALIERVFTNLIENSLRFSRSKINLEFEQCDETGLICAKISDDGVGIPQEDLPRIFERFYRVEKSRRNSKQGSGLGLAIAKKIIELHEGVIEVESLEGKKTVFSFKLPT